MPIEQIEELGLKRRAGAVGVEVGKERILGVLSHERAVKALGKTLGERGLAHANRTIDPGVVEVQVLDKYIRILMRRAFVALLVVLASTACASAPPPAPPTPTVGFETKMSWILRLEDRRMLRDPVPPAPPPPAVPATKKILAPPP